MKQKSAGWTRPGGARRQDGEGVVEHSSTVWIGGGLGLAAKGQNGRSKSYQQGLGLGAKKAERKVSKGKGKEIIPGCFSIPLSPRVGARALVASDRPDGLPTAHNARTLPTARCARVSRYRLAGAAAEELIKILGAKPTEDNRRLWAYYCYHHDIEIIFEKAYQYASEYRQGEIRNPVTAFQRWLSRTYGCEGEGSR